MNRRILWLLLLCFTLFGADCPMGDALPMGNTNTNENDNTSGGTSSESDWNQAARLTAFDAGVDDLYSNSIAAADSLAIVGAPSKNALQGIVDIFVKFAGQWTYHSRVVGDDARFPEQGFGTSVAVSNTRLFVGAPKYAIPGSFHIQRGALYVFANRGQVFDQIQLLTIADGVDYEMLGSAMAYDDDQGHLIVGAPGRNDREGAAYVFRDTGGTFVQTQRLTASDAGQFHDFGAAMAMSNVWAAIGAPNQASGRGAVYVFERMAADYVQIQKITAPDGEATDRFGSSVAMEDDLLIISAPAKQRSGDSLLMAGYVYVYRRIGGEYMLEETIIPGDDLAGLFGNAVAVHKDRVAITAGGKGRVVLYEKSSDGWAPTATIVPNETRAFDSFGSGIDFLDDFIMISSPSADVDSKRAAGAAYIFDDPAANQGPGVTPGVRI
ncbi:MAG: hypothetical protein H6818_03410 [Phycisphaerales bacterium]|nr:hypothetical protein [Phycisphaerales bacterium]